MTSLNAGKYDFFKEDLFIFKLGDVFQVEKQSPQILRNERPPMFAGREGAEKMPESLGPPVTSGLEKETRAHSVLSPACL